MLSSCYLDPNLASENYNWNPKVEIQVSIRCLDAE